MAGLTLDAGPIIAYERGNRAAVTVIKLALRDHLHLTVSAATVTEVWRGGPRSARVARLLATANVHEVDEELGMRAGVLLGAASSSNTLDALVVATAEAFGHAVLTGDVADLQPLADVAGVDVRAF